MTIYGLAAALLLTGSALALSACGNMGMGSHQPSPATSSRAQADRQAVAHIQTQLQQLGYYNGAIDGSWGSESRGAMANFQQSKGLPASGEPDQPSLNALAATAQSSATGASGNARLPAGGTGTSYPASR